MWAGSLPDFLTSNIYTSLADLAINLKLTDDRYVLNVIYFIYNWFIHVIIYLVLISFYSCTYWFIYRFNHFINSDDFIHSFIFNHVSTPDTYSGHNIVLTYSVSDHCIPVSTENILNTRINNKALESVQNKSILFSVLSVCVYLCSFEMWIIKRYISHLLHGICGTLFRRVGSFFLYTFPNVSIQSA